MLERIWRENFHLFRRTVRAILIDPNGVEDVLQECYLRLIQAGKRFDSEREAFNYIRKSVVHTTYDFYRRGKRYYSRFHHRDRIPEEAHPCVPDTDPLETLLEFENSRQQSRLLKRVRRAVKALPAEQQEALDLIFGDRNGRNLTEVCRERGLPYSTVRSRMLRAVALIQERLDTGRSEPEEARKAKAS